VLVPAGALAGEAPARSAAGPVQFGAPVEIHFASRAALSAALRSHPARVVRVLGPLGVAEVVPERPSTAFARLVRREPGIRGAQLTVPRTSTGALPAFAFQPISPATGAAAATALRGVSPALLAAARTLTIGVIDTGADTGSPALVGRVAGTYDVVRSKRAVRDHNGHGTFVASVAATGGAKVLVVNAAGRRGFDDFDVAAGILYAVSHGAKIVNLSIAGPTRSPIEESAIRYAVNRGALVIAAAGNDAAVANRPEFPAAFLQPVGSNGVGGFGLSVGASDASGRRAAFSEYGSFLSLVAPGIGVLGGVNGGYGLASGTSFAAPQVSMAAALVWAVNRALSAREVAEILKQSATGRGAWTQELGFGVLDIGAALARASAALS
jgi:subtilisin family serine protease